MSTRVSKNFTFEELCCKCGCGLIVNIPSHVARRQRMRDFYGKPIIPTSSTRCRNHPAEISKTKANQETASHPKGYADDISAPTGGERAMLVAAAIQAGYRRIGINVKKGFIHLDDDPSKLPNIWVY